MWFLNAHSFKGALYEIQASHDPNVLNDEENLALNSHKLLPIALKTASFEDYKPNQGRSREYFTINSEKYNEIETFAIKIRAIDFNNNAGLWSPVLIVKLKPTVVFSRNLRNISNEEIYSKQKLKNGSEPKESFYSRFLIGFAGKNNYFFITRRMITINIFLI